MGKGIVPSTATIVELLNKGYSQRGIARPYNVSHDSIRARAQAWEAQQKRFRQQYTQDKFTRTIIAARENKTSYGKERARENVVVVTVPKGYMTAIERECV